MSRQLMKIRTLIAIAACATLGTAWTMSLMAAAPEKDQSLSVFMRKKLDASSRILEGLTTEDAAAIKEGGDALLEMSKAELWNVIADADYREFNRDFRSAVQKLNTAAEKENFDNATLQWFDTVKGCIECHKYVRTQRATLKD